MQSRNLKSLVCWFLVSLPFVAVSIRRFCTLFQNDGPNDGEEQPRTSGFVYKQVKGTPIFPASRLKYYEQV
ncbi:hypothetical protein DFS33DRAFT_155491 [Desarmillaria ectypa]|nr:hypothetical protein DFS33DRAFT_155491 [Desarmillaria ectypa]